MAAGLSLNLKNGEGVGWRWSGNFSLRFRAFGLKGSRPVGLVGGSATFVNGDDDSSLC